MKYQKKILVIFLVLSTAVGALVYSRIHMDDSIMVSHLSQQQLWCIEHAEEMLDKAFNTGIPHVRDEEALLLLIEHAWQWDKNAMVQ
ncbi:MAG: hypothetical protein LBV45_02400, partial [Xanthomonadaceae bacterium]|nr:hypothetical protein [Xanthomonadaceae bacterium]